MSQENVQNKFISRRGSSAKSEQRVSEQYCGSETIHTESMATIVIVPMLIDSASAHHCYHCTNEHHDLGDVDHVLSVKALIEGMTGQCPGKNKMIG
jgi:hypothetical protein